MVIGSLILLIEVGEPLAPSVAVDGLGSFVAPGKAGKAEESSSKLSDLTIVAAEGSSSSSGLFCEKKNSSYAQ